MTGLEWEILKNKSKSRDKRHITISKVAEIVGYSYPATKQKIHTGNFTVNEALAIMSLFFDDYSLDLLEYLFTEQKNLIDKAILKGEVITIKFK